MRRLAVGAALAAALAVAGLQEVDRPAAAAELHHAAVVIDTGDGTVRKFCLTFPEDSISGAEALRRVESEVVFASYGGKGQGVCSLCGTGCPAGDCFCDRSKYWAYHRAGPGGEPYTYSRAGVSSTVVRDGDVEGWKWGTGSAPPAATVGEVCEVPEPPVRAASGGGSTASTTTTATAAPPTTEPPTPAPSTGGTVPPAAGAATTTPPRATATTVRAPAGQPPVSPDTAVPAPGSSVSPTLDQASDAGDDAAEPEESALDGSPAGAETGDDGLGPSDLVGLAGFVALLGGVLVWRARLRRADVQPVTPVR